MKVHYVEDIASHSGPESCAVTREDGSEALTGVRTGQVLSRERMIVPGADMVTDMEGNTDGRVMRAPGRPGVVEDPGMRGHSLHGLPLILLPKVPVGNIENCRVRRSQPSDFSQLPVRSETFFISAELQANSLSRISSLVLFFSAKF